MPVKTAAKSFKVARGILQRWLKETSDEQAQANEIVARVHGYSTVNNEDNFSYSISVRYSCISC